MNLAELCSAARTFTQLFEKISHFDGIDSGRKTLVAFFSSCPLDRLLQSIGGDDAETNGQAAV